MSWPLYQHPALWCWKSCYHASLVAHTDVQPAISKYCIKSPIIHGWIEIIEANLCWHTIGLWKNTIMMIINSWTCTHKCTASAAYASKITTLTTAHSLPRVTLVYRVLGSFCTLDRVCVESGCVPSSEYASSATIVIALLATRQMTYTGSTKIMT